MKKYSVGVFLQSSGMQSDEIGLFDTYEEAKKEEEFYKRFIPKSEGYIYKVVEINLR